MDGGGDSVGACKRKEEREGKDILERTLVSKQEEWGHTRVKWDIQSTERGKNG